MHETPDSPPTTPGAALDDLLVRAGQGDRAAFAQVYERTCGPVYGLVSVVVGDRAPAEKVTVRVFTEVWRTARRFGPGQGDALSWILALAHRQAVERVRAVRSVREWRSRALSAVGPPAPALTTVQHRSLTLTYWGGFTYGEVAGLVGISPRAAKRILGEALHRLQPE